MTRSSACLGLLGGAALAGGLLACSQSSGGAPPPGGLSRADLLKPSNCAGCHPTQYAEWSQSMHAYADTDPVFLAMNARGQRETDGGLGVFCVNCHAPMAVRDGKTDSGLDMASLPEAYHGVTCFFCHSVESVQGSHNAELSLSTDLVMRGEYDNPVANGIHQSAYSVLHDENHAESASMCGTCHDIVTPLGAAIERTFAEWKDSSFSTPNGETCGAGSCHMTQTQNVPIAENVPGVPLRVRHGHDFPAVDVPLGPAADAGSDGPSPQVQAVVDKLSSSAFGALCVESAQGTKAIRVFLDAVALGHDFPSGASQDRRLWIEVNAYAGGSATPFYSSGHVPVGTSPVALKDPDLWLMRDCMFGADGREVHMFWQAAGTTDDNPLPPGVIINPGGAPPTATHIEQFYPRDLSKLPMAPDRVTLDVWLQPVGRDVLDDLVDSGDLDPAIPPTMPTFQVALGPGPGQAELVWTADAADAGGIIPFSDMSDPGSTVTCVGTLQIPAPAQVAANHTRCSP